MNVLAHSNILLRRLQRLPDNVSQVIQIVVLSLAAGLSAVGFLFMTNLIFSLTYIRFAARSKLFFGVASFLLITGTSLLIVFEMTHQFDLVPGLMLGLIISRAVGRLAGRLNFYDASLVQDGHELHKIRPPLDLKSWQNLPVSAIANPHPVIIRSLEPAKLKEVVDRYPYASFPYQSGGKLKGVLSRQRILEALLNQGTPEVQKAVTCYPRQTVREIGNKFIKSPLNVLIIVERKSGAIQGIITLHDLIRAQASINI